MTKTATLVCSMAFGLALATGAQATDADVTVNWKGVSLSQLSLARVWADIGPKVRKIVCASYRKGQYPGSVLKTGGEVRVHLVGTGNQPIATFTVTKGKCD